MRENMLCCYVFLVQFVVINSYTFEDYSSVYTQTSLESEIVFPKIYDSTKRRRRDITSSVHYEETVPSKIIELNDWILELDQEESSLNLHENFIIYYENEVDDVRIFENGKDILEKCQFRFGKLQGFEDLSFVSVSICGSEIRGYLRIGHDSYLVEPYNITATRLKGNIPHVLYNNRQKRSIDISNDKRWEFFNLTGDTIDFDDEQDDVDDNFEENNITEAVGGFSEPIFNITFLDWDIDPEITGYFVDSAWESKIISKSWSISLVFVFKMV